MTNRRRVGMIAMVVGLCAAAAASTVKSAVPPEVENRLFVTVQQKIHRLHFVPGPTQCVSYQFDGTSSRKYYYFYLREDHEHPECGGSPGVAPHVMTVRIDRKTEKIEADWKKFEVFQSLPESREKRGPGKMGVEP